jgi:hypothetical protein
MYKAYQFYRTVNFSYNKLSTLKLSHIIWMDLSQSLLLSLKVTVYLEVAIAWGTKKVFSFNQ